MIFVSKPLKTSSSTMVLWQAAATETAADDNFQVVVKVRDVEVGQCARCPTW